jgi:hypothetical protein
MAEQILDGTGSGERAKVDGNKQLHVFSVTETEQRQATAEGNEYNLNSGDIALTGTGESSLIYLKNDENTDFVITAIALGIGIRSATVTDLAKITIIKNPQGGDIITDATLVDINSNTNFGSSKELSSTSLVYKGKDGGTITGGSDHAILYSGDGRLYANLNIELPKGSSVGVKIDLNTSGGANVYCALIGYLADQNNSRVE